MTEPQAKWLKDYWICANCAEARGGIGHDKAVTAKLGECKYCKEPNVVLIPYVDFDWPNNPALDEHSKRNRD